ncbi:hypothetical protein FRC11_009715 [Ceratobasidium sp. 423]|nr:hypothetical protein FRC11_009715 [Ceratobasidium sp. 423]
MERIINQVPDTVDHVLVEPDGKWRTKDGTYGSLKNSQDSYRNRGFDRNHPIIVESDGSDVETISSNKSPTVINLIGVSGVTSEVPSSQPSIINLLCSLDDDDSDEEEKSGSSENGPADNEDEAIIDNFIRVLKSLDGDTECTRSPPPFDDSDCRHQ